MAPSKKAKKSSATARATKDHYLQVRIEGDRDEAYKEATSLAGEEYVGVWARKVLDREAARLREKAAK